MSAPVPAPTLRQGVVIQGQALQTPQGEQPSQLPGVGDMIEGQVQSPQEGGEGEAAGAGKAKGRKKGTGVDGWAGGESDRGAAVSEEAQQVRGCSFG